MQPTYLLQTKSYPQFTSAALEKQFPSAHVQREIAENSEKIKEWYKSKVMNYSDKDAPRICVLNHSYELIKNNLTDKKYINQLFLYEEQLCDMIKDSNDFVDIGFFLMKHIQLQTKKKDVSYGDAILKVLRQKFDQLLQNEKQSSKLLRLSLIESFLDHKAIHHGKVYNFEPFDIEVLREQITVMYKYVFAPIFEAKTPTEKHLLYPIVNWLIALPDETDQQEFLLFDLTKKINIYICGKKVQSNIHFISIFNLVLNLLSVKYLVDDPFRFETLAPLLNEFESPDLPVKDLINNWLPTVMDKDKLSIFLQYIFRNSLNSGSIIFTFHMIEKSSKFLHDLKDYGSLFHLFENFIRKDYLNIQLPNSSFLPPYLEILYFYTIGFINRDRLDGQTQLDKLTNNLRCMVFQDDFSYNNFHRKIIMFYKIYQNRFFCLSNSSKKFVQNLQTIYKDNINVMEIHEEVQKHMFKEFSASYDENDLLSLKRSQRYIGLSNLGNTCYMNSYMQALYMTKKFKTLIIQTRDSGTLPKNMETFQTLIRLFSQLSSKKAFGQDPEVDPLFFKEKIPEPFKSSWDQHDSGEFGRLYLDSLSSEAKSLPLGEKVENMFSHKINQVIVCKKCNYKRQKSEKIFDVILHFNEEQTNQLAVSSLLRNYFKGIDLGEDNKLFCSACSQQTLVSSKIQPEEFGEYIIATISIFRYEGIKGKKLIKPLNFQFILNLKNILPQCNFDVQYELYAFIVHMGTESDRGHYICYARNLQQNPMIWYCFNDNYVTEREVRKTEDFKFGKNETPYILFYSSTSKHRQSMIRSIKH